jgi:Zn-dependent protease with chaperone function
MSSVVKTNSSKEILAVSPQFRKQATKAIATIICFIVVYLLMFALSLGLVALCFYGGFSVIALRPSFYTLLIGGGIVAVGVMIFVFLIKFLFATSKADESDSIEINYDDQPKLFDTIYALAKQAGAAKPKKIFLSSDVNACVFYNSSFWSMFLPIPKNLKIGLGLVNAVNVSELKAVIAHEFGHFSQRSMKLGSWVYGVNKIIHDMLYNNRGYADTINGIARIHGVLAFFAQITVKIVQAIQWVLQQMFKVVNKAYMALSREMEFHADLVAASVCGSNNIVSSLKRVEFAGACFGTTIEFCNTAWKDKKVVNDFYSDYTLVMKRIAELNHLSFQHGLPVMKDSDETVVSRINYKDQWASHPTLLEREENLNAYSLESTVDHTSAWSLFAEPEKWKQLLTQHIYKDIPQQEVKGILHTNEFETLVDQRLKLFSFPEIFGEYYDNRQVAVFDPAETANEAFVITPFEELLSGETIRLPKQIALLQQDIAVLKAIIKKELHIRSFDFDGKKYAANQSTEVLAQLEGELEQKQNNLATLDKTLFRYFCAIAPLPEAESLKEMYITYFNERKEADHYLAKINENLEGIAPLYSGNATIEQVQSIVSDLKEVHGPVLKRLLQQWLDKNILEDQPQLKAQVEKFIASRYEYFSGTSFFDNELNELNAVAREMWDAINQYLFIQFKNITEVQAKLAQRKEAQISEKAR